MSINVFKFGGASLANIEAIQNAAKFLKGIKQESKVPLLVVVSAMGDTTDELMEMAHHVHSHPPQRELDMLLTAGERISMSLMSVCLDQLGLSAISLTGSQAGIITDNSHGNARILKIRPIRLDKMLAQYDVVVIAGFQGVSEDQKEVTTLGRGGSDITAIALAAHYKASSCTFKKDVPGIYNLPPKENQEATLISEISHQGLAEMCRWGGHFLHYRAAEYAQQTQMKLNFSSFLDHRIGTIVSHRNPNKPVKQPVKYSPAINTLRSIHRITFANEIKKPAKSLRDFLDLHNCSSTDLFFEQLNPVGQSEIYLSGKIPKELTNKFPCKVQLCASVAVTFSEPIEQIREKLQHILKPVKNIEDLFFTELSMIIITHVENLAVIKQYIVTHIIKQGL